MLAHAAKEGIWIRYLILEIQDCVWEMMDLNCNNQGAIALSKDNKFQQKSKHIDIHYHYICEAVEGEQIKVNYIPTDDNPMDIFTKPLPKAKFQTFVGMLGLRW